MRFYEHYNPLPEPTTQFRILDILPGSTEQPILTQLRVAKLSDRPQYTAISYTWGTPRRERPIWVNENGCAIPQNLWSVLHRLRDYSSVVSVWVDALCIDQGNNDEKTCQVQLMGSLYMKAAKTIIWLGPEANNSSKAFNFVHDHRSRLDRISLDPSSDEIDLYPEESIVNAIVSLCRREYWSRAWIRQEILNSQHKIVLCGPDEASFGHFSDCFKHPYLNGRLILTEASSLLSTAPTSVTHIRGQPTQTLQTLVETYGMSKASDVRDRIYALLSLASDCRNDQDALKPDYKMTCHELFHKMVGFCHAEQSQDFQRILLKTLEIDMQSLSLPAIGCIVRKLKRGFEEDDFGLNLRYQGKVGLPKANSIPTDKLSCFYLNTPKEGNGRERDLFNIGNADLPAQRAPITGDRVYLALSGPEDNINWDNIGVILRQQASGYCAALLPIRVIRPSTLDEKVFLETEPHINWLKREEFAAERGLGVVKRSAVSQFLHRLTLK
jgi:hypothetical protein